MILLGDDEMEPKDTSGAKKPKLKKILSYASLP